MITQEYGAYKINNARPATQRRGIVGVRGFFRRRARSAMVFIVAASVVHLTGPQLLCRIIAMRPSSNFQTIQYVDLYVHGEIIAEIVTETSIDVGILHSICT